MGNSKIVGTHTKGTAVRMVHRNVANIGRSRKPKALT